MDDILHIPQTSSQILFFSMAVIYQSTEAQTLCWFQAYQKI